MPNPIDGLLARSERRTEALRAVRDAVANDPGFLAELREAIGIGTPKSSAATDGPRAYKKKGKNAKAIKDFFDRRANEWATMAEILSGTSLKKNSAVGVVYKTTPVPVESRQHPTESKLRQFRWKAA